MSTAAIILAAGASTRLGQPKQLVVLGGETLLEHVVRIAREAGCTPIIVVLGASAQRIAGVCGLAAAEVLVNLAWREGMASSIRAGIEAAIAATADAAVLMTCDQPAVTVEHLKLLIQEKNEVVASAYAGKCGVPVFFPSAHFCDLLALQGDAGARELLTSARTVALLNGELDVDTPEALASARAIYNDG